MICWEIWFSTLKVGTYTYPGGGLRPHAPLTAGKDRFSYDTKGDLVRSSEHELSYDPEGRVIKLSTIIAHRGHFGFLFPRKDVAKFNYDWGGSPVVKTESRHLPYPLAWIIPARRNVRMGRLYECDKKCTSYFLFDGNIVARSKANTSLLFYSSDLLRSSRILTDAKGSHVQLFDYDAYGEPTELHRRRTVDPSFRFNEQPFDTKHRLYFYQSRFYDPKLSRFISPDSSLGVAFAPQSLNGYSYVQNNPQSYTDMTGMQPDDGDGDHGGSDDSREPNVPDHPDNAKDYSPPDIVMVYRVSDSQKSAGDESGQDSEDKDRNKEA